MARFLFLHKIRVLIDKNDWHKFRHQTKFLVIHKHVTERIIFHFDKFSWLKWQEWWIWVFGSVIEILLGIYLSQPWSYLNRPCPHDHYWRDFILGISWKYCVLNGKTWLVFRYERKSLPSKFGEVTYDLFCILYHFLYFTDEQKNFKDFSVK